MKGLLLAFGGALAAIAGVAAGCGGAAFTAGDAGAGPGTDAAVEAATGAESGAEAGEGAAPPVDAGTMWCSGHTETFCEDFDEYTSIATLPGGATWPTYNQTNGGFQFDTMNAPSPPNALQVMGDDGANVLIVKTFAPDADGGLPQTVQKVTLTFDLRVNSAGPPALTAVSAFAAIAFGTSISDGYVAMAIATGPSLAAFWVQSASTNLDAGSFKPAFAMSTFPTLGTWAGSFSLEISYAANPNGCVQVYRGVTPELATCLPLPPEFASPKLLSIALGDVSGGFGKTNQVNLEFDNVTFNIK
jgi:hypothetical protein